MATVLRSDKNVKLPRSSSTLYEDWLSLVYPLVAGYKTELLIYRWGLEEG